MMEAIKVVSDKYDLVHIEGYTPGYDLMIDDNYKKFSLKIISSYKIMLLSY